jgi:hypothetical protein
MNWGCREEKYVIFNDSNELTVLTIMALALVGNRLSHELANCYEEAIVYRVLVSPTCPTSGTALLK